MKQRRGHIHDAVAFRAEAIHRFIPGGELAIWIIRAAIENSSGLATAFNDIATTLWTLNTDFI